MDATPRLLAVAVSIALGFPAAYAGTTAADVAKPAPTGTQNDDPTAMGSVNSDIDSTAPCAAAKRDYAAYFSDLYNSDTPLMNECALGSLMNFDTLKLFDPMGQILDAMRGAACGLIRDNVNPFITNFNRKVSSANQWVSDQNRGYSDWVDEEARKAAGAVYAPPGERFNSAAHAEIKTSSTSGGNTSGAQAVTPAPSSTSGGNPSGAQAATPAPASTSLPITPNQVTQPQSNIPAGVIDLFSPASPVKNPYYEIYQIYAP